MKVDYVLIKAAGYGTRMGTIGQYLPKILWPIFEKKLLELQLAYAQSFSPKIIFINVHHQYKMIEASINEYNSSVKIVVLHEDLLLDSGGPIYNVKQHIKNNCLEMGKLLLLNGDQFIFTNEINQSDLDYLKEYKALLYAMPVPDDSLYNRFFLENGFLADIIPGSNYVANSVGTSPTFSGIAIIDLNQVEGPVIPTPFFKSPIDYQVSPIPVKCLKKFQYFDFGTKENYQLNIVKLLNMYNKHKNLLTNEEDDNFFTAEGPSNIYQAPYFFIGNGVFNPSKVREKNYGASTGDMLFNFSDHILSSKQQAGLENSLILSWCNQEELPLGKYKLFYDGYIDDLY